MATIAPRNSAGPENRSRLGSLNCHKQNVLSMMFLGVFSQISAQDISRTLQAISSCDRRVSLPFFLRVAACISTQHAFHTIRAISSSTDPLAEKIRHAFQYALCTNTGKLSFITSVSKFLSVK